MKKFIMYNAIKNAGDTVEISKLYKRSSAGYDIFISNLQDASDEKKKFSSKILRAHHITPNNSTDLEEKAIQLVLSKQLFNKLSENVPMSSKVDICSSLQYSKLGVLPKFYNRKLKTFHKVNSLQKANKIMEYTSNVNLKSRENQVYLLRFVLAILLFLLIFWEVFF